MRERTTGLGRFVIVLTLMTATLAHGAPDSPRDALGTGISPFWGDRERGWFWFEDPPRLEEEKPAPAPTAKPAPAPAPQKAPEIQALEKLQKRLEDSRKIAIMNPTEPNVLRYLELEARMIRQASYFGDVAQRLGWTHASLDMSLEGRPVNFAALQTYNREEAGKRQGTIATLARDHVLMFFFRGDCPYCHTYAPILKAFAESNGLTVLPISLDGGGLPEFPSPKVDNGISKTLNVAQVPATFVAQPFSGKISPLGFGVLSSEQLAERLTVITSPDTAKMLPGLSRSISFQ